MAGRASKLFAGELAPAIALRLRAVARPMEKETLVRLGRLTLLDVEQHERSAGRLQELFSLCERVLEVPQGKAPVLDLKGAAQPMRDDQALGADIPDFVSKLAPRFEHGFVVAPPAVKTLIDKR